MGFLQHPQIKMTKPLEQRFWAKVQKTKDCWKWTGVKAKGYGMIRPGGMQNKIAASRVSWMIHFGTIPEGMHVLHKCDNPECTNPEHLFLGTHADNMRDKETKNRSNRNDDWLAANIEAARQRRKLTEQEACLARQFFNMGASLHGLARMFQVDRNAIRTALQN